MLNHVIYPQKFDPGHSAIYALNEVDVKATPEAVWKLLVDAENWSSYFPAEDQVKILTGEPELALGTKYSRVTVGFPMHLIVTECVPGRRLSWSTLVDGDETGSSAFHGWVITPTDKGCHVLSEETQQGPSFLEELGRKNPSALYRYHQEWVESLGRAAEKEAAKATSSIACTLTCTGLKTGRSLSAGLPRRSSAKSRMEKQQRDALGLVRKSCWPALGITLNPVDAVLTCFHLCRSNVKKEHQS